MPKAQRQLRFAQLAGILVLAVCIAIAYMRARTPQRPTSLGFGQVMIVLLAVWSGIGGITVQRRLRRRHANSAKSTPFTRWRAGHIFRLWSTTAVGLWAVVLSDFHGPLWIVDLLLGFSMLLLLTWRPDNAPEAQDGM